MTAEGSVKIRGSVTGISVGYNPDRPWYAKWHSVRQALTAVEAASRSDTYRGNDLVRAAINYFFLECFHMGDWLWEDASTGLSRKQVRDYIDADPALAIADGVANTLKHRVRSKPGAMTAQIASIGYDPNGVQAVVGWTKGRLTGNEDALDLARRCVAAWEAYLAAQGLHSPI